MENRKKCFLLAFAVVSLCGNVAFAQTEEEEEGVKKTPVESYVEGGRLHFATKDGKFHWWLDNRIYLDAAAYMPDDDTEGLTSKKNSDLDDDDGNFRFSNGVILRRARMAIKATLYDKWFAEFDLDYAYDELNVRDMYLGYKLSDRMYVKAGQFKEPMSIESTTSSKYLQSAERPMPVDIFASGRHLGASLTAWGKHWWASGGVFGSEVDLIQQERNRGGDGYAFTGRVAVSPIHNDDMTVHLGAYATRRTPDANGNNDRTVEFRGLPESNVDRRRFVDAEVDNVDYYYTLGYELAFRYKKLLLFGEYVFTNIDRYDYDDNDVRYDLKNCEFDGWYVSGSYMILGQARRYAPDEAEFGPMPVRRKGGNLEIAAHYSTVNLNDFHDYRSIIYGGEAHAFSASLNWYPKTNLMVGLNYTYMNNDKYADAKGNVKYNGEALSVSKPDGIDFSILQMRLMIAF